MPTKLDEHKRIHDILGVGPGGGGGTSDHGSLQGLDDDDHTQYLTTSRANTWFATKDHGSLQGLNHDDHTQYTTRVDWAQNGFENRTDSTLAWTDSSPDRTLSIQPTGASFNYWVSGVKYSSVGDTIQISNVEGVHFIYYDVGGAIASTANPTLQGVSELFRTKCLISIVQWDVSTSTAIYVGEERHGKNMSPETHTFLHFIEGLSYYSGLGLNTINADGSGVTADAQFGVDAGAVSDEDLFLAIGAVTSTTGLPIYYMLGGSAEWQRHTESGFSVRTYDGTSATRLAYNQYTGGAWQLTEATNNGYVLCHVFATTEKDKPMVAIMGQNTYATKPAARAGAQTEIRSLILNDILFPEFRPIATVIFQTSTSYASAVNARIVSTEEGDDYVDWRSEVVDRVSISTTDHGSLTGLGDDDHPQYFNTTRGDARYYTETEVDVLLSGINHGDLENLGNDDHTQYLLVDGSRAMTGNLRVTKVDPEIRLTDTGDSEYTRITRSDTNGMAVRYNRVNKLSSPGNGLDFDGSPEYAEVIHHSDFDITDYLTISCWAYIDLTRMNNAAGSIVGKSDLSSANKGYTIFYDDRSGIRDQRVVFTISQSNGILFTKEFDISSTGWFHIVGTFDKDEAGDDKMQLYVNNVASTIVTFNTAAVIGTNTLPVRLGRDSGSNNFYFKGLVDEVIILNTAWSSVEVANDYNSGQGIYHTGEEAGFVAGWHLDESAGTNVSEIGGVHDMTAYNISDNDWVTGKVLIPGQDVEVVVWSSKDGTLSAEEGIQTFGDPDGRHVVEGQTTRFNIGGVEVGRITESGLWGIGTTSPQVLLHVDGEGYFTGNVEIEKADPELRLTDTGDSEYTRITRADTNALAARYNRVRKPSLGNAVDLGTNEWFTVPHHSDFNFGNGSTDSPFSISAWINISQSNFGGITQKGTSASGEKEFMFGRSYLDSLYIQMWDSSNGASIGRGTPNDILPKGQWLHVVATYDGTGYNGGVYGIKIYLNAVQKDSQNIGAGPASYVAMEPHDQPVYLGNMNNSDEFYGRIDELVYYDKELSQAEVTALYAASNGYYTTGAEDGFLEGWHFDETTGTNAASITGNHNATGVSMEGDEWVPGKVSSPGDFTEATVWNSQDGVEDSEEGIQTFGDPNGRHVVEGKTTRFNIGGAEIGEIDEAGWFHIDNLSEYTAASGVNVQNRLTIIGADDNPQLQVIGHSSQTADLISIVENNNDNILNIDRYGNTILQKTQYGGDGDFTIQFYRAFYQNNSGHGIDLQFKDAGSTGNVKYWTNSGVQGWCDLEFWNKGYLNFRLPYNGGVEAWRPHSNSNKGYVFAIAEQTLSVAGGSSLDTGFRVKPLTLAATSPITVADAASFYVDCAPIAGGNMTITNAWAFYLAQGDAYFGSYAGIGVTPVERLDVNGGIRLATASGVNAGTVQWNGSHFQGHNGAEWLDLDQEGNVTTISGEAGQVAFFTDATTISGENNLFWDSTNNRLGIGTTTPQKELHIVGPDGPVASFPSSLGGRDFLIVENAHNCNIALVSNDSNSGAIKFYNVADSGFQGMIKYEAATDLMQFGTLGRTDDVTIDSDGNVGIGTASPADKLEVRGSSANIRVGNTAETEAGLVFVDADAPSTQYSKILFDSGTTASAVANTLNIYCNSATSSMTFTSAGNVGIGTTSPGTPLHVYSTGGQQSGNIDINGSRGGMLTVEDQAVGVGSGGAVLFSSFGDTFAHIKGYITDAANYGAGHLVFGTRTTTTDPVIYERMRLTNSGRLGIGTNSPGNTLHVVGDALFDARGTTGNKIKFMLDNDDASGDPEFEIASEGDVTYFCVRDGGGNAGNVGIGTASPGNLLHILNASAGAIQEIESTAGSATINLNSKSTEDYNSGIGFQAGGVTKGQIYYDHHATAADQKMYFKTGDNAVSPLTLLGNGNVGIGNAAQAPSVALLVRTAAPQLIVEDSTNNVQARLHADDDRGYCGTASNHDFRIQTNASAKVSITTDGKVGIGTTTIPKGGVGVAKFAVEGTSANLAGPHIQYTTSANNYPVFSQLNWAHDSIHMLFDAFYDGDWKSSDVGSNFAIAKNSDALIFKYDSAIAAGDVVPWHTGIVLNTSGRVGIGDSPAEKLHVKDTTAGAYIEVESTAGSAGINLNSKSTEDYNSGIAFQAGGVAKGQIYYDHHPTAASQKMYFGTGDIAVTAMTLDGAGNVGIGTASPSKLLHVYKAASAIPLALFACGAHMSIDIDSPDGQQKNIRFVEGAAVKWQCGMDNSPDADAFIISQLNNPTAPEFIINTGGKIGIGTATAPHGSVGYAKLALDGLATSADGPHVQITVSTDDYPVVQMFNNLHDSLYHSFDSYYDAGGWKSSDPGSNYQIAKTSDQLQFNYDSGVTAGTTVTWNNGIVLNTSGYVGVKISPSETLHVNGGIRFGAAVASADGTIQWTGSDIQGRKGGAWVSLTAGAAIAAGSNKQVQFNNSGSMAGASVLGWDETNDYLGVGTLTPGNRLHVYGNPYANIKVESAAGDARLYLDADPDQGSDSEIYFTASGVTKGMIEYSHSSTATSQYMDLQVNSATGRVRIQGDGHVGVNTSSPDAIFEVECGSSAGHQAMTIDQNDTDQAFIDFQGSAGTSTSYSIFSPAVPGAIQGFLQIEVNGSTYWIPYYDSPGSVE